MPRATRRPPAMRSAFSITSLATGAPLDAEYITAVDDPTLPNDRALTDTATVTWDFSTPGQAKANAAGGGGGGAPTGAQYLVSASDATLTAERVVTDTASITWDFSTAGQAKANATGGRRQRQCHHGRGALRSGNTADGPASPRSRVSRRPRFCPTSARSRSTAT